MTAIIETSRNEDDTPHFASAQRNTGAEIVDQSTEGGVYVQSRGRSSIVHDRVESKSHAGDDSKELRKGAPDLFHDRWRKSQNLVGAEEGGELEAQSVEEGECCFEGRGVFVAELGYL